VNSGIREYGEEYSISVNTSLALVNNPNKADGVVNVGAKGKNILILNKAKNYWETHPHRSQMDYTSTETAEVVKSVVTSIKEAGYNEFSQHILTAIKKVERITPKRKPEYVYIAGVTHSSIPYYSKEFIDYIIEKRTKNSQYFIQMKQKYRKK
jgi:hypothetical protein